MAFVLSVKVTSTSLTTTPSPCLNMIYERLTLTAVHYIDLLVTVSDLYLIPVSYLVNTTYEDKATIDIL